MVYELSKFSIIIPIFVSATQLVLVHSEHCGDFVIQNNIYALVLLALTLIGLSIWVYKTSDVTYLLWTAVNIAILAYHIKIARRYTRHPQDSTLKVFQEEDRVETIRLFITSLVVNTLFLYYIQTETQIIEYKL